MNQKTMRARLAGVVFVLLAGLIWGTVPASAETPVGSNDEALLKTFDELGVQTQYRDALLAKINDGGTPDSESGATPTSSEVVELQGEAVTRETFADGSVALTSVEVPEATTDEPGKVSPYKTTLSGCHAISNKDGWKRRTGCLVRWKSLTMGMGFEANYSVKSGGKGRVDKVVSRKDLTYNNTPGRHITGQKTYIGRKSSTSSMYAWGRTWVTTELAGITTTWHLDIRVKGSAWATSWK